LGIVRARARRDDRSPQTFASSLPAPLTLISPGGQNAVHRRAALLSLDAVRHPLAPILMFANLRHQIFGLNALMAQASKVFTMMPNTK
jgi:hypothetical protein